MTPQVRIPAKLVPVFQGPADVRGAYGGRGSAKTRTFAKMTAVRAVLFAQAGLSGVILCGRQYMNSLADSSLAEIQAAIAEEPWLAERFDVGEKYVRTLDGRVEYVFAGLDRSLASIKSTARILLAWIDEAEPLTEQAYEVLDPTLREEGTGWNTELWVTWNPERKNSATDKRYRSSDNPRHRIVEMNWRDNPWFPAVLERKRAEHKRLRPDTYDHVWEGAYRTTVAGSYFASQLTQARAEGRIGVVPRDPLMRLRAFVDIGGTGAKADNFVIWVMQFVGLQIRVLDHYEVQGQPLETHLQWLHLRGYTPQKLDIWLPHDGKQQDKLSPVSYESELKKAGYAVTVVPNQGRGAAAARIERTRDLFPSIWVNEATCEAGLMALGAYHEKQDPKRGVGLGPEHDWASHSADAFGLGCIVYQPPSTTFSAPIKYRKLNHR